MKEKGRIVGVLIPGNRLHPGEAAEIVARGGKVFRNPTGEQVGIRFPRSKNNDLQLSKGAKTS
jgi:hypothetical protein